MTTAETSIFGPMPLCWKCGTPHKPALCATCHAVHPVVCASTATARMRGVAPGQTIGHYPDLKKMPPAQETAA